MQISIEEMGVFLMKKQNNFLTENPEYIAGFLAGCRASVSAEIFKTFGEKYDYDVDSGEFYFGYEQGFKDAADIATEKAFSYDEDVASARNLATELRTLSDNAIACREEFGYGDDEDDGCKDWYEEESCEENENTWEMCLRKSNPSLGSGVEYKKIDTFENIKRQLIDSRNMLGTDSCEHDNRHIYQLYDEIDKLESEYIVKQVLTQYAELKYNGDIDN